MMRLFLIEKQGNRRLDLGLFRFNDIANCINAAKRRHKFIDKLETNGFDFEGQVETGPLKLPKQTHQAIEQLSIEGA